MNKLTIIFVCLNNLFFMEKHLVFKVKNYQFFYNISLTRINYAWVVIPKFYIKES
jgi:hypothetical protein